MKEIQFVDEVPGDPAPNSRLHRQRLREFADAVRKKPGQWAVFPYPATDIAGRAAASRISRGKVNSFGDGFEAVSRRGTVYVRYVDGTTT